MISDAPARQDLLSELTEPQRLAVTTTAGPVLVLAGAGSGKTRVITRRAAYLAATVTHPANVLAITFTNKAAGEMKDRIAALGVSGQMTVCTFHAWCARVLRVHHRAANLAAHFTIVDQSDRRKLIKNAIEEAGLSASNFSPAMVESRVSLAKNDMCSPTDFADRYDDAVGRSVAKIYAVYERLIEDQQLLDFDDLLLRVARLMQEDADVLGQLADQYRYVLIDEYQDTNAAQYRIAGLLCDGHRNLFVSGDPDQSIYGWRGADIRNILFFERDYSDAVIVRLEQNYRSTKCILRVADCLISANLARKEKTLWTQNEEGCPVRLLQCPDSQDEALAIVEDMRREIEKGRAPRDFSIFYRVNSMSRVFEEELLRAGIAYRIARGTAFYERKEIKDLLAYLRVLINPADQVSLERIFNVPARGIGKVTVDRLKSHARRTGQSLLDVARSREGIKITKRAGEALEAFVRLIDTLREQAEEPPGSVLEQTLSLSGLRAALNEQREYDPDPADNVDELISAAVDFERRQPGASLIEWLAHTSLLGDADVIRGDDGAVTLMTLHAAKGLEFPVVYIVGVEDGRFPLRRFEDDMPDMEEERRLLFVGMTRAKQRLVLSRASWRTIRNASRRTQDSPFLDDLPRDQLECIKRRKESNGFPDRRGLRPPEELREWQVGTLVRDADHRLGQVMTLYRSSSGTIAHITFTDGTEETVIVEHCELKRVEFDEVD